MEYRSVSLISIIRLVIWWDKSFLVCWSSLRELYYLFTCWTIFCAWFFFRDHNTGYYSFNWKVGAAPAPTASNVCRHCFMTLYGCSHGYIDAIVRNVKDGVRSYDRAASDCSSRVTLNFLSHLENMAAHFGVKLTRQQLQAISVPNSVESLSAFGWMHNYFSSVGEHQPKVDEIHLDPCTATHIWEEYKQTLEDAGEVRFTSCYDYFYFLIPKFV